MKLIVGLGNPGSKYKNNRHNLGFKVIDFYLKENNLKLEKKKFKGQYIKSRINDKEFIIAKPMNFMNNSGEFIYMLSSYFGIEEEDILIIYDDKDILFNNYKIKKGGSSAGHNGINNIIAHLDKNTFTRLRCGVGPVKKNSIMKFVMEDFSKKELKEIEYNFNVYLKIINDFIINDFKYISNKYSLK